MAHTVIMGCTESGKTTLAVVIAKGLKRKGHKVAVLDPVVDRRWQADFITSDPAAFLQYAKTHTDHFLFIDEGGSTLDKYNPEFDWLTTTGRHLGHSVFVICHRLPQLSVTLRFNCSTAYLFAVTEDDATALAKEYREPALRKLEKFSPGQFYKVGRFSDTLVGSVDFASQTLKLEGKIVRAKVDDPGRDSGRALVSSGVRGKRPNAGAA